MSGTTNEDEWDAAEERLKVLTVKEKKPPVKLLLKPPMSLVANSGGTSNAPAATEADSPNVGGVAELDSVLLNVLSDPRERMVVFQIENNILNFVNSTESTMEIPASYNSFRRLLSYKLGHRFGLSHTVSDQLNENGERATILYKTTITAVPSILLIDMSAGTPTGGGSTDTATGTSKQAASAAASAPQRKMQVMKRKPAVEEAQSTRSSGAGKQQQSSEDKEKAYLEARARIFGDTGTPSSEGSCPSPVGDGGQQNSGSSTPKSESSVRLQVTDTSSGLRGSKQIPKCPSSGSLAAGIAAQNSSQRRQSEPPPIEKSTSSGSLGAAETGGNIRNSAAPVNAGQWKENKSQVRNLDAERSDPDFVRRGTGGAGSRNNRNSGAGGGRQGGGGGTGYAQNQNQQQQQVQQQQSPQQQGQYMYADPAQMQAQMQMQLQMQMQMQAQMQMQMYQQNPYPPAGGIGGAPYQPAPGYPMGPGLQQGQFFVAPPPPGAQYGGWALYPGQQYAPQQPSPTQRNAGQGGGALNSSDFPPLS